MRRTSSRHGREPRGAGSGAHRRRQQGVWLGRDPQLARRRSVAPRDRDRAPRLGPVPAFRGARLAALDRRRISDATRDRRDACRCYRFTSAPRSTCSARPTRSRMDGWSVIGLPKPGTGRSSEPSELTPRAPRPTGSPRRFAHHAYRTRSRAGRGARAAARRGRRRRCRSGRSPAARRRRRSGRR